MSSRSNPKAPLGKRTTGPASKASGKKASPPNSNKRKSVHHADGDEQSPKRTRRTVNEEKRLKRFRSHPPTTYLQRLERVRSQRMFLIERKRDQDGLSEVFDIAGSTGNIYQVIISKVPDCNCPDALKGNQCKHIIYVMINVLKAREDLAYQLALLSTELIEIFTHAPSTPQSSTSDPSSTEICGSRKPVEGDCPICVMEFEADEEIVWCKAACGNNVHKHCFTQWAKSKPGQPKCVYCRTPWKDDGDGAKNLSMRNRKVNETEAKKCTRQGRICQCWKPTGTL